MQAVGISQSLRIVAALVGLLLATSSFAECLCRISTTSELYMNADVIFVGKVLKQAELPRPDPKETIVNGAVDVLIPFSMEDPYVYLVSVSEVIKDKYSGSLGSAKSSDYVYVRQGGHDCGMPLIVGKTLVILATHRGSKLFETSDCDGTVVIEEDQDFFRRLQRIKATMDVVDKEEHDQKSHSREVR